MVKVLLPFDGSDSSSKAVKFLIKQSANYKEPLDIHLLNVQPPLPGTIRGVGEQARQYHHEEGMAALKAGRQLLDEAKLKYEYQISVGEAAHSIAQVVTSLGIDLVVMGTRGMGSVGNMLMGSVASKVLHLVGVPVLLVK